MVFVVEDLVQEGKPHLCHMPAVQLGEAFQDHADRTANGATITNREVKATTWLMRFGLTQHAGAIAHGGYPKLSIAWSLSAAAIRDNRLRTCSAVSLSGKASTICTACSKSSC
jgi:hypothetical protein